MDASSTGGPKATATGARPTLRRARHRARSSPRQPRPAEMGVGADFTTSEKGKWGGNERERVLGEAGERCSASHTLQVP